MKTPTPSATYGFTVYAGYHQFYLMDADPAGSAGASDSWTREAFHDMLATNPGIVGIGTGTYGNVPVVIEFYGSAPDEDFNGWDHVKAGA